MITNAVEYIRICWMHNQMKNGYLQKDEYFDRYGTSQRTFNRDIDRLRDQLLAPIAYDRKHDRYYYSDNTYELPLMLLNEQDLFGLLVSTNLLHQYKDTPFYDTVSKIMARLAQHLDIDVTYLYREYSTGNSSVRQFNWEYIHQLTHAVHKHISVDITYTSFNSNTKMKRRIDPYHIYNYEGDFYCVGYCHKNNGFRDFFIGRITDLNITDIVFKPRKFGLEQYFSDKQWGMMKGGKVEHVTFKIRRDREQWLIEEFGHKITFVEQSNDWTVYETEVIVNNDFLNWAVGFNKGIIILKPESVKKKVVKHLKMLMQEYE